MKVKLSKFFLRLFLVNLVAGVLAAIGIAGYLYYLYNELPPMITVKDYKPLLSSDIYARGGEKIGELYSSKQGVRFLTSYENIPPQLVKAFVAAEDGTFFTHNGFNFKGIFRAVWINLISGQKTQGASTITQQTARTLFLTPEKTYIRKLREALLTYKMEKYLNKEEIIYLYLNQIYLGQGAYGVAAASETYFRKPLTKLSLAEMAMLAGLPTSPSRINPVINPQRSKERQVYTLQRMVAEGYITSDEAENAEKQPIQVQAKKTYKEAGPYFVETVRQMLVKEIGEQRLLEEGLKIQTSLDLKAQMKAMANVQKGLREVDKRRGFRGPKTKIDMQDPAAIEKFLTESRSKLIREKNITVTIQADGKAVSHVAFDRSKKGKTPINIPPYIKVGEIVEGLVTKIDDGAGLAYIKFAESEGVIPLADMAWARKFNPELFPGEHLNIKKPSSALIVGDVVDVKVLGQTYNPPSKAKVKGKAAPKTETTMSDYAHLALEQEPEVQGALLSFDLETGDITAMVGGLDYAKYKFNRAYQALRQTGSAFKPFVYAAGLEKGLTVATPIMGAPIVFGGKTVEQTDDTKTQRTAKKEDEPEEEAWKPENYDGKFTGDVLMRTALKKSLNTPTIRVLEKATVPFAADYAKRLGIVSPLNMDLSFALGSSAVSVYEMNKAISVIANAGRKFTPILIREVATHEGEVLVKDLSLDQRFKEKLEAIDQEFQEKREAYKQSLDAYTRKMASRGAVADDASPAEKPPVNAFFFNDPNQLISPLTAYLTTNMLQGVAMEPDGTGGRAAALNRPVAGKTGTTSGYYDAWFLGYTVQYATTVWVGLDTEKTLGKGETGGDAALPIWLPFMQQIHEGLPVKNFEIPEGIVFASVDKDTGRLSPNGVRLPFIQGTEPGAAPQTFEEKQVEEKNFLRESF